MGERVQKKSECEWHILLVLFLLSVGKKVPDFHPIGVFLQWVCVCVLELLIDRQKRQFEKKMAAQKELPQRITHVYLSNTRLAWAKDTQYCNISSGLVWHVNLSVFSKPCLTPFFFLRVWCGVRFPPLSRRPLPQNTGVEGGGGWSRSRGSRPMEICWELCLTKCSNIILSSRISTHASKVHLPARARSLPFLSLFLSTEAGVGWLPWRPSV